MLHENPNQISRLSDHEHPDRQQMDRNRSNWTPRARDSRKAGALDLLRTQDPEKKQMDVKPVA
jgi:hypothetical protein